MVSPRNVSTDQSADFAVPPERIRSVRCQFIAFLDFIDQTDNILGRRRLPRRDLLVVLPSRRWALSYVPSRFLTEPDCPHNFLSTSFQSVQSGSLPVRRLPTISLITCLSCTFSRALASASNLLFKTSNRVLRISVSRFGSERVVDDANPLKECRWVGSCRLDDDDGDFVVVVVGRRVDVCC